MIKSKTQKYFAKKVIIDGHKFDSTTEGNRYLILRQMLRKGEIKGLKLQECFEILPKQTKMVEVRLKTKTKMVERVDELAVHYHCDFFYWERKSDKWIIEEVKSEGTKKARDYPLRKKLVKLMIKRLNEDAKKEVYEFREIIT